MKISIITVFPEIHHTFLQTSLIGKAQEKGLLQINLLRFSDFCSPKERIDEPTVGHGSGMIIKPELVEKVINHCEQQWGSAHKIFFSPQGTKLNQNILRTINESINNKQPKHCTQSAPYNNDATTKHIILVCSRYEGMDARVEALFADHVVSIGDYVLMGGDLPAQVFLEGFLRLIPGIVGKWESVEHESFSGPFLDHPEYGLPVEWNGLRIPEITQSGNHKALFDWRSNQACNATILNRFDWFASSQPDEQEMSQAWKHIPNHYVALMHTEVKLKDGTVGTTSITSIDLHDTARSCATYGIKNFFMVNPLHDQQSIIQTFLTFWRSDEGKTYNQTRYDAVSRVKPANNLDEVIDYITTQTGKKPIIIATSAKVHRHATTIDYTNQGAVWQHNRPVLFLFGTGQGMADSLIEKCDYLLVPVNGMTSYNHLSVRSAIAIILDRWLGLHPQLNKIIKNEQI